MKTILFTATMLAVIAASAPAALADSGETAVVESRAALTELWGRSRDAASDRAEAVAKAATLHRASAPQVQVARPANVWADNYAAGRVHEPADHT